MPRSLLDLIASVESPGYDVAYGGTKMPSGMTLEQTLAWQKAHGQKTGSSAVGRYQFIRPTLQGLVKETGLPLNTKFTPAVQDMLATKLMERRGLNDYVSGKLPPEQFARNLSQEWAGLPSGPAGGSYYAGDKMGNKAGVGWDQVIRTLERPDVRMAANTTGSTDTDRTPSGDPATGRMLPPRPPMPTLPPFPSMPPDASQEPSAPSWLTPIVSLLAGAAMGRGSGMERVLSGAALAGTGIAASQQAENELLELKQKREDARRKRRGQDALDQYADTLSQNPETAELGAMIRMDPGVGMRMYAEQRQAQMEAQQREQAAQILEQQNKPEEAAYVRAGANLGAVSLKGPEGTEYGTALNAFEREPGKWVQGFMGKDGTVKYVDLPGPPVTQNIGHQGELAREKAEAGELGKGKIETMEKLAGELSTISTVRQDTEQLLSEFEAGKYDNDVGPLIGRLKGYWDPETAIVRANSINQGLQALKITNLAPVSNEELKLVLSMGANPDFTSAQNIAVLKRLASIQAAKEEALRGALQKIQTQGYDAYLANPVEIKVPSAAPTAAGASGGWKIEKE